MEYISGYNLPPEVASLLGALSLESCTEEREFISRKRALRAPMGKAFKVGGAFYINEDNSESDWSFPRPIESRELFLSQVQRGEGEGIRHPESFMGQWLIVDGNEWGDVQASIRGSVKARAVEDEIVYEGGEAFPEYGVDEPLELFTELGEKMPLFGSEVFVKWSQEYVTVDMSLGRVCLSLVEQEEAVQDIYTPPVQLSRDLLLPHERDSSDTLDRFKAKHQVYLEYRYQRKFSDSEMLAFVRGMGTPLVDDPLRDFIFIDEPEGEDLLVSDVTYKDRRGAIKVRRNLSTDEWLKEAGIS